MIAKTGEADTEVELLFIKLDDKVINQTAKTVTFFLLKKMLGVVGENTFF